jgi:hypothetical protein
MVMFSKQFRIYVVLFILGVSSGMFLTGCSKDEINIVPNVLLSVTTLDFGQVTVGQFFIQTVTIRNLNNTDVTVERITSTDAAFQVGGYFANGNLINLVVPFTIGANASSMLYVGFYPIEGKTYRATIVIESVDTNSRFETDLIDLQGIGL